MKAKIKTATARPFPAIAGSGPLAAPEDRGGVTMATGKTSSLIEARLAAVERAMAETQLFIGDLGRDLQHFAFETFEGTNRLEGVVAALLPKEVFDAAFAEWQKRTGNEDEPAEA
jgi:hypothetical protein